MVRHEVTYWRYLQIKKIRRGDVILVTKHAKEHRVIYVEFVDGLGERPSTIRAVMDTWCVIEAIGAETKHGAAWVPHVICRPLA